MRKKKAEAKEKRSYGSGKECEEPYCFKRGCPWMQRIPFKF